MVINGIMESWRQRQDKIRFIQVRPEEAAALRAGRIGEIYRVDLAFAFDNES